jgi:ElaB/YqjD/DUF883 family membrane-anchored ribosome-binding protein
MSASYNQDNSLSGTTRRAIEEGAEAVRPAIDDAARATGEAFRRASRKASAVVSEFGGQALDTGTTKRDQLASHVQTQPVTSIVIAAALGLVAGLLFARH